MRRPEVVVRGSSWPEKLVFVRRLILACPSAMWVLGWMGAVEVSIRVVPLDLLGRHLGVPLQTQPTEGGLVSDAAPLGNLRPTDRRRLAVLARLGPRWPFGDGPCLRQSLVTGRILRRFDPVLRIGVKGGAEAVTAHAWVEVRGRTIGQSGGFAALSADGAKAGLGPGPQGHG